MDLSTIDELTRLAEFADKRAGTVSAWSVGAHIQHLSLAMSGISKALLASSSPMPPARFSLPKFFVLLLGRIPRGKGKAPKSTIPEQESSKEELLVALAAAHEGMVAAQSVPFDRWFQHPMFGPLTKDQTLTFVEIHNSHHLEIIKEILAAR